MSEKKNEAICVDFDGVLAEYNGFQGEDHCGEPISGAREFLEKLISVGLEFVIFTARDPERVKKWFEKYSFPKPKEITNIKIPAPVYIDDRAIKFEGNFSKLVLDLKNFKPYWRTEKKFEKYFK